LEDGFEVAVHVADVTPTPTPTPTPTAISLAMDYYDQHQVVIILTGLIGSGKSTFALALQKHYPNFVRCNQDDLGDRRAVESKVRQALSQGKSVCVDRTNFDASAGRG